LVFFLSIPNSLQHNKINNKIKIIGMSCLWLGTDREITKDNNNLVNTQDFHDSQGVRRRYQRQEEVSNH
jgi:hypothetical protein